MQHRASKNTSAPLPSAADFAALAAVVVRGGPDAAQPLAEAVAWHPGKLPQRRSVSRERAAQVYSRDRFTCRYCERQTILAPVLELLARLFPEQIPFVSHHYPSDRTHPAFVRMTASVDHVLPIAVGGSNSLDNLVTACWPCNVGKADLTLEFLGWDLLPVTATPWLGLTDVYFDLWLLAGRPNPALHGSWMCALGIAQPVDQRAR